MGEQKVTSIVNNVMGQYGISKDIWYPIMQMESGGNPNAAGDSGKSIGLFQINTGVHKNYSKADLKNPAYNSKVAAENFILPAMKSIGLKPGETPNDYQVLQIYSGLKNPIEAVRGQKKRYLEQGGIRPLWTDSLRVKTLKAYRDTTGKEPEDLVSANVNWDAILPNGGNAGFPEYEGYAVGGGTPTTFVSKILRGMLVILVIIGLLILSLKLFDFSPTIGGVKIG
jgi:hypothetical protein